MKTIIFLALLGFGAWYAYGLIQKQKAAAEQKKANEAVRWAQGMKAAEVNAARGVEKANAAIHAEEKQINEGGQ